MKVTELNLSDWRNIGEIKIRPAGGINIFVGRNGQGKTNILEAINYVSLLRSRASKETELIRWGQREARIRIKYTKAEIRHEMSIAVTAEGRRILQDGQEIRPRELPGKVKSVLFTPEDLIMFKGSPTLRRKYLDAQQSQAAPQYFMGLLRYRRTLELRNALLKKMRQVRGASTKPNDLDLWDEQLWRLNMELVSARLKAVERMNELLKDVRIMGSTERLTVVYAMRGVGEPRDFLSELRRRRARDIERGATSIGAHVDDLRFLLNGRELSRYGSQGQIRTAALALKITEVELVKEATGEYPLLMLDDVMSELDRTRREMLIEYLSSTKIQTLITATEREYFPTHEFGTYYKLEEGRLTEC